MVELLDFTPAEGTPMTDDRLPLAELMAKADDGDFLRSVAESVLQILMEADVEGMIGPRAMSAAASGQPTATAIASGRSTRAWDPEPQDPQAADRSYFPGFLEPRRTVEKALVAVIQEA